MPCRPLESDRGRLRVVERVAERVAEKVARAYGAKGGGCGCDDRKKRRPKGRLQILLLRRALDSNQRIPYDIGSLANCWFKPLTQPSLNHLFCKRAVQIYDLFSIMQNFYAK